MLPTVFYILIGLIVILLGFIVVVLARTLMARRTRQHGEPADLAEVNGLDLAANLAEVIQCQTLSHDRAASPESGAFLELHEILKKNYPLVHQRLTLEKVNSLSLLYTWKGRQPGLDAVLFAAHQDVVPVDDATLAEWSYPPFSGAIAEGFVWGRGAMDIKCQMTVLLDTVEKLLKEGFQPLRTVYLAFGHDEEIGGTEGAAVISDLLKSRGVRLGAMIDEGGGVVDGAFPGIEIPIALIGIAEKGSLTLELSVSSPPGHSSAPPQHTSIGILAQALTRLERSPLPGSLVHIRPLLRALAPHSGFLMRMVFANLWFFGGVVERFMAANPQTNALLRTTTAITMIEGGIKANILPPKAASQVNYRLIPGDSPEDVIAHTRRVIADPRIKINLAFGKGHSASSVSPAAGNAYELLRRSIQQVFGPGPISPFLVTGGTDSRHYTQICDCVYRFSPFTVGKDDIGRVHGIGERISLENLEHMARFFLLLVQTWSEADSL